jgi:hypothetical protein
MKEYDNLDLFDNLTPENDGAEHKRRNFAYLWKGESTS